MDISTVCLIALGGAAFFGLQGAITLAVRHALAGTRATRSPCDRLVSTRDAFIAGIPVAFGAVGFYLFVLFLLIWMMISSGDSMPLLAPVIIVALPVTCYYAYILFFKLRVFCMGCIRIYLANGLMGGALLGYYWF